MSGGSMDHLYAKIDTATFRLSTTRRRAFKAHLQKVSEALRAIEWEDSGDSGEEETEKAIKAVLTPGHVLEQLVSDANQVVADINDFLRTIEEPKK